MILVESWAPLVYDPCSPYKYFSSSGLLGYYQSAALSIDGEVLWTDGVYKFVAYLCAKRNTLSSINDAFNNAIWSSINNSENPVK